jgi:hypothetical protein
MEGVKSGGLNGCKNQEFSPSMTVKERQLDRPALKPLSECGSIKKALPRVKR